MGNKKIDTLNVNGIPLDDTLNNIVNKYSIFSERSYMDKEHICFIHGVVSGVSFGYIHYKKKSINNRIKPGCCFRINNIINNDTTVDEVTKCFS